MLSVFAKYNAKRQILTLSSGYATRFAEWHIPQSEIEKHAKFLLTSKSGEFIPQDIYLALKPRKTPDGKNDTLGVTTPSFINNNIRNKAIYALFSKTPVLVRRKIKVDTHASPVEVVWQESFIKLSLDANNEIRGAKCAGGPPLKMPWEQITSIEYSG
tara:strand:- start:464 stop:937 length:474 start_codon:yes stop_codon:yes gene_type:complete